MFESHVLIAEDADNANVPAPDPVWARPALLVLAIASGVLYGWDVWRMHLHLYYGAAVKTMSSSWPAFLYGAYDPGMTTTVDKVPGVFWLQALSAWLFGFHSWSVLLPQVLGSVLTILVLYRVVRLWSGPVAGIVAAAVYATTPMIAALARTQIPDVILVLLVVLAAGAWWQAIKTGKLAPLLWCGVLIGLAFQAKMVHAWSAWLPFALTYLFAATLPWQRRLARLAAAGAVTVAVSAIWVVPMLLIPASSRPYIDGSMDNSVLSMVFGYNAFNRFGLSNDGAATLGVGGPLGGIHGPAWDYMFSDAAAPQVGWLYPIALAGLIAGLLWSRSRADRLRLAGYAMWGLWLLTQAVTFSLSVKPHSFYLLSVVPPIAGLAGAAAARWWSSRTPSQNRSWWGPATVVITAAWMVYLNRHFASFYPWLIYTAAVLAAAAAVVAAVAVRRVGSSRPLALTTAGVAAVAMLLPPAAWSVSVADNLGVVDAHRPAGGPTSLEIASVLSGRMLRVLPTADMNRLISYLRDHAKGDRFTVAVPWAPQSGPMILAGLTPLPVGGFTAQTPNITPERLTDLVARGDLHYALVDGPAAKGMVTPDYPSYAPWVRGHCTAVDEFTNTVYILYRCE
jgi:4-amino-4-deoxy-L-arabinose transferase-like glycosyltransferase